MYENLARHGSLRANKDFEALGSLVETLHKIASLELKQSKSNSQVGGIDLVETLGDLRIVLEPTTARTPALKWSGTFPTTFRQFGPTGIAFCRCY